MTELAEPFEMSMPAISKHLKVLDRAGLIARGRDAQWRPCRDERPAGRLVSGAGSGIIGALRHLPARKDAPMAGNGGHKHRQLRLKQKRSRSRKMGRENIARVQAQVEAKGQTWDPVKNSNQAQALSHYGRRVALK